MRRQISAVSQYKRTAREVVRFGVVGGMATLTHFIVLNGTARLFGVVLANGVAFCCAVWVTYFGQSIWVFKQPPLDFSRMRKFMVSAVGGLILNIGLMAFFSELLGWHYNLVFVCSLFLVPFVLFFVNKFWVFRGTFP